MHINTYSVNVFSFVFVVFVVFFFGFEGKYKIQSRYLGEPIFQSADENWNDPSLTLLEVSLDIRGSRHAISIQNFTLV